MSVADDKFFGPLRAVDIASIQAKSKARGFAWRYSPSHTAVYIAYAPVAKLVGKKTEVPTLDDFPSLGSSSSKPKGKWSPAPAVEPEQITEFQQEKALEVLTPVFFDPHVNSCHLTIIFADPVDNDADIKSMHLTIAAKQESEDGNENIPFYNHTNKQVWLTTDLYWDKIEKSVGNIIDFMRKRSPVARKLRNYDGWIPGATFEVFKRVITAFLTEAGDILRDVDADSVKIPWSSH